MRYSSALKRNYQDKSYRSSRTASAAQENHSLFYELEEGETDHEVPVSQTSYSTPATQPSTLMPLPNKESETAEKNHTEKSYTQKNYTEENHTDLELVDEELTQEPTYVSFDPHTVWQTLLSELALQMPSASYNTWVRDTWVIGYEDGEFLIGIPNAYARDWLENRLRSKIKRALSMLVQRSVQVNFRVSPRSVTDLPTAKPAPLYQLPAEELTDNSVIDDEIDDDKENDDREIVSKTRVGKEKSTITVTQNPVHVGSQLNPLHTFETFVVGNHNKLAHAAAEAVAENPGQSFNPLFIYGGVGLGKTHLLHAIGNRAQQLGYQMLYCSSEQFTNEMIGSIRNQSTEQFRNKYRDVDLLLIDDIQFIGGKESTQEEFFHTFNHLHAAGRQVILSSDRPPKALGTLEERLRSRFEGGLQTDISQPDYETRVAILQSKANRMGVSVDAGALSMVAERVDSNIRELEGALNRLIMQARLVGSSLSVNLASSILNNLAPTRAPCTPSAVLRIVAAHFRLQTDDLTGRKRTKDVAIARQVAMYLLREENGLSLPAIGEQLGGRDHSTVRYGVEQVAQELEHDEDLRHAIVLLRDKIYIPFIG